MFHLPGAGALHPVAPQNFSQNAPAPPPLGFFAAFHPTHGHVGLLLEASGQQSIRRGEATPRSRKRKADADSTVGESAAAKAPPVKEPLCEHRKHKRNCAICGGEALCPHKKSKMFCRQCRGGGLCKHNRRRLECVDCGGSQICEHKRIRKQCVECGGSQICEHKKVRSRCRLCGGSQICEHNRRRNQCKECGGSQVCVHKRIKTQCKECGGAAICEHGKRRGECKECGGSQVCPHGRRKKTCRECNSDSPSVELKKVSVLQAGAALKKGEMVAVTEQLTRPGDRSAQSKTFLALSAAAADAKQVARLLRLSSGILVAAMPSPRLHALGLRGPAPGSALGVGVDCKAARANGVSPAGRAETLRALAEAHAMAGDFAGRGCVFPLGIEESTQARPAAAQPGAGGGGEGAERAEAEAGRGAGGGGEGEGGGGAAGEGAEGGAVGSGSENRGGAQGRGVGAAQAAVLLAKHAGVAGCVVAMAEALSEGGEEMMTAEAGVKFARQQGMAVTSAGAILAWHNDLNGARITL